MARLPALHGLLAASVLLAGCLGAGDGPRFARGDCAPSDPIATWVEPGLYAALPRAAARADVLYAEDGVDAEAGLPFDHAAPRASWGHAFALQSIQATYREEGVGHFASLGLSHAAAWDNASSLRLAVEASRSDGDPEPFARAALHSFLENATAAPADARARLVDDALSESARRTREAPDTGEAYVAGLSLEVALEAPLRLGALYDNLTANASAEARVEAGAAGGHARLPGSGALRGWEWQFALPTRQVVFNETGRADAAPLQYTKPALTVGPTGAAHLAMPAPIAPDAVTTKQWLRDAFARLGLDEPAFEAWAYRAPGASAHCPSGPGG